MDKKEASEIAQRFGWLSQAPAEFQQQVLSRCDLILLPSNQSLYHQGDDASGLFFIAEGTIGLHMLSGEGPTLGHLAGPGFWAGDLSASSGRPRKLAIRTRTPTQILRLSRASLNAIAAKDEALVHRQLGALLAINYAFVLDVYSAFRRDHPVERVAAMILNVMSGFPMDPRKISVNQADLGSIAKLSRSTISTVVSELERRGWIRAQYGILEILDETGLRDFVNGP